MFYNWQRRLRNTNPRFTDIKKIFATLLSVRLNQSKTILSETEALTNYMRVNFKKSLIPKNFNRKKQYNYEQL